MNAWEVVGMGELGVRRSEIGEVVAGVIAMVCWGKGLVCGWEEWMGQVCGG